MTLSIDGRLFPGGAAWATGLFEVQGPLQEGRVDVGFIGGAEIDQYGYINSGYIGGYTQTKVKLPGAGGAPTSPVWPNAYCRS